MLLRQIYDESLAQAAYLLGCQRSGEALVVDPERDVDRYLDAAARHELRITAVAETHIHADFLSGARELAERVGATLYLSGEGDADWRYGWLDAASGGGSYEHRLLHDADTFRVGGIELRALHTPGHTPEHLAFLVTDLGGGADAPIGLFSGDFVFVGDLGRPDLLETAAGVEGVKESSARRLFDSTVEFLALADHVQVWPAHGAGSACGKALGAIPQSTVGYERRFNAAIAHAGDATDFVRFILEGQPEPPLYFARMKVQNRDGVPLLGALPRPGELAEDEIAALDPQRTAIIDTRPWPAFRDAHRRGALFAPQGPAFHGVVGSFVEPDDEIVLVAETVEPIVRELVRIGLDRVVGVISPERYAAAGPETESIPEVSVGELARRLAGDGTRVLDVRGAAELADGSIDDGAIAIAHTRLPREADRLPTGEPLYVHCASGTRSAAAVAWLRRRGHDAINVAGGFEAWRAERPAVGGAAGRDRD